MFSKKHTNMHEQCYASSILPVKIILSADAIFRGIRVDICDFVFKSREFEYKNLTSIYKTNKTMCL